MTQNITDSEEFLAKHYKAPSVPLRFTTLGQWVGQPVPAHTIPLYEELFEACWKGNNERIKELCLPPKTEKRSNDAEYLQITCTVRFDPTILPQPCLDDNVLAEISSFKEYPYEVRNLCGMSLQFLLRRFGNFSKVYTPLHVAVLSRNWETAKVIIAIAMAQYEGPTDTGRCDNHHGELPAGFPVDFSLLPQKRTMKRTMWTRIWNLTTISPTSSTVRRKS